MYTHHFSLKNLPFENVSDPACFFEQGEYSRVLSRMVDSVRAEKGLMVVAGPIGTGKTTLSQKLIVSVPEQTRIIWLGEPPATSEELLLFLSQELHIGHELSGRVFVLRDIREYLLKLHNEGNRCLLIIDEVHKIADDVLECVRLLNNLEQGNRKLIQMLLLGQEEFLDRLSRPQLESFKQRIAWLEAIGKMTPLQTHEYIMHRLKVAGSRSKIFTDDAVEAIVAATRGTPRLVNTFCDRALRVSYETGNPLVDVDSVRQAADEIGLGSEVFLWLTNHRTEETAPHAAPQAPVLKGQSRSAAPDPIKLPVSNPIHRETMSVNRGRAAARIPQETPSWTFPILLLCGSILLFGSSVWFLLSFTE
jgi:type II secretory pathway predicted ATPase ExeA